MALLRLPNSPSTTTVSSFQKPDQLTNFSPSSLPLSPSTLCPLPNCLVFEARKTRLPVFSSLSSSSSSSDSSLATVVENPPVLESETEVEVSPTRLCAQNVPWTCTADDIRVLFEKHGTVLDVELSMHNKTKNRGLAFITMGSVEEALAALTNLESFEVEGRALKVNYSRPRKKEPTVPKHQHHLFVANLSFEAGDKDLKELFDEGSDNVVSAEVVFHDNPRRSSGYGYVSYRSRADAAAALTAFHGKMFMGRPIRVERTTRLSKQKSKVSTESEDALSELNPEGKLSGIADYI